MRELFLGSPNGLLIYWQTSKKRHNLIWPNDLHTQETLGYDLLNIVITPWLLSGDTCTCSSKSSWTLFAEHPPTKPLVNEPVSQRGSDARCRKQRPIHWTEGLRSSIKETHNKEEEKKEEKEEEEVKGEISWCQFNKSLTQSCEEKLDDLFADQHAASY